MDLDFMVNCYHGTLKYNKFN